jgi:glyoxylase-like metal-dependent hydrolase (beta-lactamase superfamily II)
MKLIPETPNLYRLTQFGMFNCFLLKEANELTLIDTNFPGSGSAILRAAASLGLPITTIALTHAHFDHVGSLDVLAQALPNAKIVIGERESRFLHGDFSLDPGETGKPLLGFKRVRSSVHRVLNDGDQVGSLHVIASAGHTPGHIAFLDTRDNSLIAGDSYITQKGVVAAGFYSFFFPMPAWFSWNGALAAVSAAKLAALKPTLLAVGHGPSVLEPSAQMARAAESVLQQHHVSA